MCNSNLFSVGSCRVAQRSRVYGQSTSTVEHLPMRILFCADIFFCDDTYFVLTHYFVLTPDFAPDFVLTHYFVQTVEFVLTHFFVQHLQSFEFVLTHYFVLTHSLRRTVSAASTSTGLHKRCSSTKRCTCNP